MPFGCALNFVVAQGARWNRYSFGVSSRLSSRLLPPVPVVVPFGWFVLACVISPLLAVILLALLPRRGDDGDPS